LEADSRLENIEEFLTVTKEFEKGSDDKSLISFLTDLALVADIDQVDEEETKADDKIVLMTLHSAKGLEFPLVFLIGLEEGVFPHSRSLFEEEEMEEERRLAYVGITRAEKELYLTNAKIRTLFGRTNVNPASRFIQEIPEELLVDLNEGKIPWKQQSRGTISQPAAQRRTMRPKTTTTGGEQHGWKVGDKAAHGKWGTGTVVSTKGEGDSLELDIAFPQPVGIKRLLAKFAPITKA
jgi:DNA helicase II / ATP-dependent DNA helicase PcrA